MAPWRPPRANPYPVIVFGRVRCKLDYEALDARMRARIVMRKHAKGMSFAPVNQTDKTACDWIAGVAARYGIMRWRSAVGGDTRPGKPRRRGEWVKEKPANIPVHFGTEMK